MSQVRDAVVAPDAAMISVRKAIKPSVSVHIFRSGSRVTIPVTGVHARKGFETDQNSGRESPADSR